MPAGNVWGAFLLGYYNQISIVVTEELLAYIKGQLESGISRDAIMDVLKGQGGWDKADIADAFAQIGQEQVVDTKPVASPATVTPATEVEDMSQKTQPAPVEVSAAAPAVEDVSPAPAEPVSSAGLYSSSRTTKDPEQEDTSPVEDQPAPLEPTHYEDESDSKGGVGRIVGFIVLVIVLLGLAGGGAYAYFTYYAQKEKTPSEVLSTMMVQLQGITSLEEKGLISMDMNMSIPVPSQDMTASSTTSSSTVDMEEINSPATYMDTSVNLGMDYIVSYDVSDPNNLQSEGTMDFDLSGAYSFFSVNFNVTIDGKFTDNKLYLKFKNMTPLPIPVDLTPIDDKWIIFDFAEIASDTGMEFQEVLTQREQAQEVIMGELTKAFAQAEIQQIIDNSITNLDEEGAESDYLYRIQMSAEDWSTVIASLFDAITSVEGFYVQGMEESDLQIWEDEMRAQLEGEDSAELYALLSKAVIDMTINKETFLPTYVEFALSSDEFDVDGVSGDMSISVQEEYTKYNEPVAVTAPDSVVTVNDILGLYGFGGILNGASDVTDETTEDSMVEEESTDVE